MTDVIEGDLEGGAHDVAVVAARWHSRFSDPLIEGAIGELTRHGVEEDAIRLVRCPGSFELPQTATKVADSLDVDAIVCLGVLVRGETPHFDHIASEATSGIGDLAREGDVPVAYGLLTCDTMKQAMARSGSKQGNKGAEAARAILEMANLWEELERR